MENRHSEPRQEIKPKQRHRRRKSREKGGGAVEVLEAPRMFRVGDLAAVARLKGITTGTLAAATKLPIESVSAYLSSNLGLPRHHVEKIATVLGVSLKTRSLSREVVHIFFTDKATNGASDFESIANLINPSKAAIVRSNQNNLSKRMFGNTFIMVQNDDQRILFVDKVKYLGLAGPFDVAQHLAGCRWVKGSPESSVKILRSASLTQRMESLDLIPSEYDEVFEGEKITWREVENSARANGVSKQEVLNWVETIGRHRHGGSRASLTVIESQDRRTAESAPAQFERRRVG